MNVTIYTKAGCPFCSLLKNEMTRRGIRFRSIDLSNDTDRQFFYEKAGVTTVPQVYVSQEEHGAGALFGERLGGWSEVNNAWDSLENLTAE